MGQKLRLFLPFRAFDNFGGYRADVVFAVVDDLRFRFSDDFELFFEQNLVLFQSVDIRGCALNT